jgi:hypothetical protein
LLYSNPPSLIVPEGLKGSKILRDGYLSISEFQGLKKEFKGKKPSYSIYDGCNLEDTMILFHRFPYLGRFSLGTLVGCEVGTMIDSDAKSVIDCDINRAYRSRLEYTDRSTIRKVENCELGEVVDGSNLIDVSESKIKVMEGSNITHLHSGSVNSGNNSSFKTILGGESHLLGCDVSYVTGGKVYAGKV